MKNSVLNIGLLVGDICTPHATNIINGAIQATEDEDVNIVLFLGCHSYRSNYGLDTMGTEKYGYQFNVIYDYTNVSGIDILVIAYETIKRYIKDKSKEEFLASFHNIPIVLIGNEAPKTTSILIDNYSGIKMCLKHLIEDHGYTKICHLAGPVLNENNRDAKERLMAYLETMKEYNLPVTKSMIEYGDYSLNSATQMGLLIDNNPGVEAIVAANDTMALTGYDECKKRGLIPGKDIAFTGYDDIYEAVAARPQLTTVEQNTYDLGYTAIIKAIEFLKTKKAEKILLPVYFKHRSSCGIHLNKNKDDYIINTSEYSKSLKSISSLIIDKALIFRNSKKGSEFCIKVLYSMLNHIYSTYFDDTTHGYDIVMINESLQELMNKKFISMSLFSPELIKFLNNLTLTNNNSNKKLELIKLIGQIQECVQALCITNKDEKLNELRESIWNIPILIKSMISNMFQEEIGYLDILKRLTRMNVENTHLFLLENSLNVDELTAGDYFPKLHLVAQYKNNNYNTNSLKNSIDIINNENKLKRFLPKSGSHCTFVFSIFSEEKVYGLLAAESNFDNIVMLYSASLQLGTALSYLEMNKKQLFMKNQLEETLKTVQNKNEVLNYMSVYDELTGLLNRRGFLDKSLQLINSNLGKRAICIYADLDHLKEINDVFGHIEGDSAIRIASRTFYNQFTSSAIIGRIGGDEFVAICIINNNNFGTIFKNRLKQNLCTINSSRKPYYIEMSIGYEFFVCKNIKDIQTLLSSADKKLYVSKKFRRTSVIK